MYVYVYMRFEFSNHLVSCRPYVYAYIYGMYVCDTSSIVSCSVYTKMHTHTGWWHTRAHTYIHIYTLKKQKNAPTLSVDGADKEEGDGELEQQAVHQHQVADGGRPRLDVQGGEHLCWYCMFLCCFIL